MRRVAVAALLLAALLLAGCAAPGAIPPAAAPTPVLVAAPPPPPVPPSSMANAEPPAADVDVAGAERALEASSHSCVLACRTLGSMDRVTGRLCAMIGPGEDHRACDDAKAHLRAARERVRSACGACPGGTSVDPNGPIPSP